MASKKFIYYHATRYGAAIGVSVLRRKYVQKFQTGNAGIGISRAERYGIRDFYATIETDKKRAKDIRDDYFRDRDGYETKVKLRVPKVPARPVFVPYSKWPGLADRIVKAAQTSLNNILAYNARKAQAAA